jgi:hypothetical protein
VTDAKIDILLETQFSAGRLYAAISSRPGQCGRADGYVLEGRELEVCCATQRCYSQIMTRRDAVLPQEDQNGQTEACTRIGFVLYLVLLFSDEAKTAPANDDMH